MSELVSFQRIHGLEQLGEVQSRFAVNSIGEQLDDFLDTAAAMQSLDLVITPDRRSAISPALGVPIWLALRSRRSAMAPGRSDSPWYPSMRLFRQTRWGDWTPVFEQMAAELPTDRIAPGRDEKAMPE